MSLETNVTNAFTRAGQQAKTLKVLINNNQLDLSALTTTAKSNLVAAINELKASLAAVGSPATINDAAENTTQTWSSERIVQEIINVAGGFYGENVTAALDTLEELGTAINNDPSFAATVATSLGLRVRVDTATQGLTTTQQDNARANIGAASAVDVGSTTANFVAVFEAALV
jgi:hypothetical protein